MCAQMRGHPPRVITCSGRRKGSLVLWRSKDDFSCAGAGDRTDFVARAILWT